MSNHIIHSQKMMLTVASQQDWELVQAQVKDFCSNDLPDLFNSIFDQVATLETIRIDQLNLNLGNVPLGKLTEILREQISFYLLNQLKEYKLDRTKDGSTLNKKELDLFKNADGFSKKSISKKGKIYNQAETQANDYEALVFYLETGTKPWWLSQEIDFKPAIISLNLFKEDRLIFIQFLGSIKNDFTVFNRLKQLINKSAFFYKYHAFDSKNIFLKYFISVISYHQYDLILDVWISNMVLVPQKIEDDNFETWLLDLVKNNSNLKAEFTRIVNHFESESVAVKKNDLPYMTLSKYLKVSKQSKISQTKIRLIKIKKDEIQEPIQQKLSSESLIIENAGLVIFHPFIKPLFKQLQLINEDGFLDELAQQKAIVYLHYLVFNELPEDESLLLLNKILCGAEPELVIQFNKIAFSAEDLAEAEELKKVIIGHWSALGSTSPDGFTETFLRRNGSLNFKDGNWNLDVEKKGLDILLNQLPWGLTMIKLQWNKYLIQVNWSI